MIARVAGCGALLLALAYFTLSAVSCADGGGPIPNLQDSGAFAVLAPQLDVDGVTTALSGDAGLPATIPAGAGVVQWVGSVLAPSGSWTATVTASGALAVPSQGDAGGFTRTFDSDGVDGYSMIVPLTVTSASGGEALIQVALGDFVASFSITVTPTTYSGAVACIATFGAGEAGCAPPSASPGLYGGGSPYATEDSGITPVLVAAQVEGGALYAAPAPLAAYFQGEQVYVLVAEQDGGPPLGETWSGTVTASGSLALLVDGGATTTEAITLTNGVSSLLLPAEFLSAGPGTLALQIGQGTYSANTYVSGGVVVAPVRGDLVTAGGSSATDILTVCTSAASGTITASVIGDAGAVTTPTLQIGVPGAAPCPYGLPGQAAFAWTGTQGKAVWDFAVGGTTVGALFAVPMPGFPLTAAPPSSTCIRADAGAVLAWVDQPPLPLPPAAEDASAGDAQTDAGPEPGTLIVDIPFVLYDCSADASPPSPFPKATLNVTGTGGLSPTQPTVTTDARGNAVIELRGPAFATDTVTAVLSYQGTAITTVTGIEPDGG